MSSVPEGNRFAPPAAHVEDVAAAGQVELAGRGARLGAAIIDGLLILAAIWAVSLVTPWSPLSAPAHSIGGKLGNGAAAFVLFLLIQGWPLAKRGQTVGKLLLDIRIVRSSGELASFGRLVGLRYGIGSLIGVLPYLGPIYGLVDALLIFRESRRCLHDLIADTIVVRA